MRQIGKTSSQMTGAPIGAVFVWVNSNLSYPTRLAKSLGREDLKIVSPYWLSDGKWRGLEISGVVVDHAAMLEDAQIDELEGAYTRIRPR